MIFYEYKCSNGHVHEERRLMRDRDCSSTCPECGEPAKKIVSLNPMQFVMKPGESYMDRIDLAKIWQPIEKAKGLNEIGT